MKKEKESMCDVGSKESFPVKWEKNSSNME